MMHLLHNQQRQINYRRQPQKQILRASPYFRYRPPKTYQNVTMKTFLAEAQAHF